jgi:hypothetical protein
MIVTEIYDGQGLGNQLWCYVTTRVIAADRGYGFGIQSPAKLKCREFLDLDLGQPVVGGSGPEGGPPRELPERIRYYYNERRIEHPDNGVDIRIHDEALTSVPDDTKAYIRHRKDEIRSWLRLRDEHRCLDFAAENMCVINFRGGEYKHIERVFLPRTYWQRGIELMRERNPHMQFVVITDDVEEARKFFPDFPVHHFGIAKDYAVLNAARHLILSNSSFAFFPAWLNPELRFCIAPKYWSQYNYSDGYWGCGYNLTEGWFYLDREGNVSSYDACRMELDRYMEEHRDLYGATPIRSNFLVVSNYNNDVSWVPERTSNYLIYNRSDWDVLPYTVDRTKVVRSPNIGYNIYDYCRFIVDHYDALPAVTLFAKGNVFPRHVSRVFFDRVSNNEYFTPIEDYRMHDPQWPIAFTSSDGGFNEINNSWYTNHFPHRYFETYNEFLQYCFTDANKPRYVRFAPGGCYIVPRQNVRKLPRIFYQNLMTFVAHSPLPAEAHIIERALHTLWTCSFRIDERMLQPVTNPPPRPQRRPRTLGQRIHGLVRRPVTALLNRLVR